MNTQSQRSPMTYEIKVSSINFDQVENGKRPFVIIPDDRKDGFKIGDMLILQKTNDGKKTDEFLTRNITGFQKRSKGMLLGYIILGLSEPEPQN